MPMENKRGTRDYMTKCSFVKLRAIMMCSRPKRLGLMAVMTQTPANIDMLVLLHKSPEETVRLPLRPL